VARVDEGEAVIVERCEIGGERPRSAFGCSALLHACKPLLACNRNVAGAQRLRSALARQLDRLLSERGECFALLLEVVAGLHRLAPSGERLSLELPLPSKLGGERCSSGADRRSGGGYQHAQLDQIFRGSGIGDEEQWRAPGGEIEAGEKRADRRLLGGKVLALFRKPRLDQESLRIGRRDPRFGGLDRLGRGQLLGAQSGDIVASLRRGCLQPLLLRDRGRRIVTGLLKLDIHRDLLRLHRRACGHGGGPGEEQQGGCGAEHAASLRGDRGGLQGSKLL